MRAERPHMKLTKESQINSESSSGNFFRVMCMSYMKGCGIERRVRNILESHLFRRAEKNVPDESIFQH